MWMLTVVEKNALRRSERKVYESVMDNGVRRIRYNSELYKFMGEEDIVRFIKAQRIQWLGHMERLDKMTMAKRVLKEKLYAKRMGIPRIRRMDDVTDDLRRMGIKRWMEMRNRDQCRLSVKETRAQRGLQH